MQTQLPMAQVQAVLGAYRVNLVPEDRQNSITLLETMLTQVPAEYRQSVLCTFYRYRNRLLDEIEQQLTAAIPEIA